MHRMVRIDHNGLASTLVSAMNIGNFPGSGNAFDALRQFTRRPKRVERCEMCSAEVGSDHPHLLELAHRRLVCVCGACAVLFSGQGGSKFKRVPRRVRLLDDFRLSSAQWDELRIPINMAFFFRNSLDDKVVVMYPSPAGATESLLPMDAWQEIAEQNRSLDALEPDVEALLVNRVGESRGLTPAEYYLLPIDECYKLVGLIRTHWRGFSGGAEVWQEIGQFFEHLRAMAGVPVRAQNA